MVDRRILIEISDMQFVDELVMVFDQTKDRSLIFYQKDFMKITEIDLDDGTIRKELIPEELGKNDKVIISTEGYLQVKKQENE